MMDADIKNSSITIRPMTLADVSRVHQIDTLSFQLPWSERSFRYEVTENRNASVWVAETARPDGGLEIAGMIVLWVILDEGHIATIAVHPDFRQRGIAQRLLAQGLLAVYERGARLAYLEVRRSNLAAQHLYEKFGFTVEGMRPRYYKDNNEDALLMTLDPLNPAILQNLAR